ncbi:hypothetical protein C882_2983 [Caenispirillum salinarum AK4]|uniref:4-fold beta flower domain-containing protein n=1 Tax=Caenispirillum salinarum AK4 TaxID=1238182 RepID=K9H4A5_9PROT|nr:hypothetical protein [Caenispirillum salinarum]EKV31919.1 hypothetical protein C882_2983 [Caenispirillum salinarum AK4]
MTPIYDSRGYATAFVAPRGHIVSRTGRFLARITRGGNVHDLKGRHIGWWRDGHMKGHDGGVAGWTREARALPVTPPIVGDPPLAPGLGLSPTPAINDTPPIRPESKFAWSRYSL